MTKLVINQCFGQFWLSHKAVMRYAELAGLKLYPFYVDWHSSKDGTVVWYQAGEPLPELMQYSLTPPNTESKGYDIFNMNKIERDDPSLVRVVEEMGDEANHNEASKLVVIDIPGNIDWFISEYNGLEVVHRTIHLRTGGDNV